jgi:cyclic pyranopterin phosphate synthase
LQVKINCVVARSANAQELENFHDFSVQHGLEVRFLELMRIGPARAQHERDFVSADEMLARLTRHSPLHSVDTSPDSTAFVRVSRAGARLGFIASESRPFCGNCSRLRLTARGELRGCLFREEGVALAGQPLDRYPAILEQVALRKPLTRIPELRQPMHEIGG